jgi:hypothetical protein
LNHCGQGCIDAMSSDVLGGQFFPRAMVVADNACFRC